MRFVSDFVVLTIAEIRKYYRWKERIIWDIFGTLAFLLSFLLVWGAVFSSSSVEIGGLNKDNYIIFLVTGSLLWPAIGICLGPLSSAFVREKYHRSSTYFFLSPASRFAFLFAKAVASMIEVLLISLLILMLIIFSYEFTFKGSLILAGMVFFLTFLSFSGVGMTLAVLGAWREGISEISFILSEVLMLLSGVFYPLEVFPESLRAFCEVLPTTQAISTLRMIGMEGATLTQIMPQLIYLAIFSIISISIAYFAFRRIEKKAMLIGI
ncbi:MAG: hypothetical protein DRP06_02450 [Candidatus Aenigmatarchaeota archaeon]|nr:MAG: hypothetical protein DRP06_02450 [Candidatus Aenigmarchaeota archaeon]